MAIKSTALITLTRVNDGKGIKSTSVTYQIWSNGTSTPTGTWSSTPPKTTADKPYLWTRTVITYSDNTQSTSYSVGSTPEGIQVGGRNLLMQYIRAGGQTTKIDDLSIKIGTGVADTCFYLKAHQKLIKGEIYTISCDASNVPSGCDWSFGVTAQNATWQLHINKNGRCYATGTPNEDRLPGIEFIIDDLTGRLSTAPNIILSNFKLEIGNKATDWTPAPEDVDEAINTERTERQSAIETKANEITSKVSETYVSNSAFEHYQNTVSTQFTQTKKDFTWSINQSVTDAKNEMSGQIDSVNGRLDGLKQTTDNVNSYMSFDNDALTLGKSDSAFKTKITNQEWSIQKNGAKVTYINDQTMYITDGQFTQSLKIGAFGFVPRANGSLDFKKVG